MAKPKIVESRLTNEPIPNDLHERVVEKIITARIGLLLSAPFFGSLATRLTLVPADSWCDTAATEGKNFYYNHKFVDSLKVNEVMFLFGHEVLHCAYDHMSRRETRDAQLFNVAADYAVNLELVDHKIGELISTVPVLYDRKWQGMATEEIYDKLYQDAPKINMQQLIDMLLDDHLDGKGDGEGESDGDGKPSDKNGKGVGRPKLSDEEKRQLRDEFREALIGAVQQVGVGNCPSGIKRLVSDLTEPKMNWRDIIRQSIEATIYNDYSFLQISRRGWDMDAIMPGMVKDQMIDICVAFDMSGSIGEEQARDFLSEVQGIMAQYTMYRIHVWCFDTQVYSDRVFTSDDLEDMMSYEIKGGGGTDFDCNWEWMKENSVEPKKFIMFTDGYCGSSWGDPNYTDTVFVIHGGNKAVAPFGLTIPYSDK